MLAPGVGQVPGAVPEDPGQALHGLCDVRLRHGRRKRRHVGVGVPVTSDLVAHVLAGLDLLGGHDLEIDRVGGLRLPAHAFADPAGRDEQRRGEAVLAEDRRCSGQEAPIAIVKRDGDGRATCRGAAAKDPLERHHPTFPGEKRHLPLE